MIASLRTQTYYLLSHNLNAPSQTHPFVSQTVSYEESTSSCTPSPRLTVEQLGRQKCIQNHTMGKKSPLFSRTKVHICQGNVILDFNHSFWLWLEILWNILPISTFSFSQPRLTYILYKINIEEFMKLIECSNKFTESEQLHDSCDWRNKHYSLSKVNYPYPIQASVRDAHI
jgi:hypothetical protein